MKAFEESYGANEDSTEADSADCFREKAYDRENTTIRRKEENIWVSCAEKVFGYDDIRKPCR